MSRRELARKTICQQKILRKQKGVLFCLRSEQDCGWRDGAADWAGGVRLPGYLPLEKGVRCRLPNRLCLSRCDDQGAAQRLHCYARPGRRAL